MIFGPMEDVSTITAFFDYLMSGRDYALYCKTAEKQTTVMQFRGRFGVRFRAGVCIIFEAFLV